MQSHPLLCMIINDFNYCHFPIVEGMMPPRSLAEVPISYMEIVHADCMKDVFNLNP